jgi:hypothetical protein
VQLKREMMMTDEEWKKRKQCGRAVVHVLLAPLGNPGLDVQCTNNWLNKVKPRLVDAHTKQEHLPKDCHWPA